jgi:hypothetical protein
VTIMAGLTIGTGFTMIVVPVLYATFYQISASRSPAPPAQVVPNQAELATSG